MIVVCYCLLMIVVGVSYCVLIVFFPFCDARYKRYRSDPWEGFIGEESEFISLINEEKSRDIMLKTGKLLRWSCIYILLFWLHAIFQSSDNVFENLFTKDMKTILPPYVEYRVNIQNYRMGKICFLPNSFGSTETIVICRKVGMQVEKWLMVMFMKNAHRVLVLTSTSQ